MITRGHIIGQIIDDLSTLQAQIEMRCKLGLTDLNKYCEDFIRDVLNITLDLSLKNLNTERSNEPGLDLGDKKRNIAYQVTSTSTSTKINNTLEKITTDQLKNYGNIKIFILGKKQGAYTAIKKDLMAKCKFSESDIYDISDVCREIISLNHTGLHDLHHLFKREFQTVFLEMEVPDKEGKYPTTISDKLEAVPNTPCQNAALYLEEDKECSIKKVHDVFNNLAKLPRITREFLEIIINTGEEFDRNYQVDFNELTRKLHIPNSKIIEELRILEKRGFANPPDEDDSTISTRFDCTLAGIIEFSKERDLLHKVLVTLDFRLLDRQ